MGRRIVVSAINIIDGGALTVLHDAIRSFDHIAKKDDQITFLVSSPAVHRNIKTSSLDFLYFPKSKKSWLFRLFFEYIYFFFYSIAKKPDAWLSLHDTSPNVISKRRYVYCHNASMFYKLPTKYIRLDFKQFVFSALYKYVYLINIKKNHMVITQQSWMADEFSTIFGIDNLLIAEPDTKNAKIPASLTTTEARNLNLNLFYPAYPRIFKNHEIIFKSARKLNDIAYTLTITGQENRYTRYISRDGVPENIKLMGVLPRERVFEIYASCDALIFPSLLETGGLPLTEFKSFKKPIIAADLPYAHETLGAYEMIYWFNPYSVDSLISAIDRLKNGVPPDSPKLVKVKYPKLVGWTALALFVMTGDQK